MFFYGFFELPKQLVALYKNMFLLLIFDFFSHHLGMFVA